MPRLDAERVALWRAFQTAGEVVSRSIEAEMFDEFHLALPQFDLLAALAQSNDQMRVKELCEVLSAVPSSLSRRIDSLVERGYVTLGELAHTLTTTTAACTDFSTVTDCDESQYFFLSSGDHCGNCARFRTVSNRIRGVFYIAANVDISARGQNRCAN